MTRYHTTKNGNTPFTPEEEAEWDAVDAAYEAGAEDRRVAIARFVKFEAFESLFTIAEWDAATDFVYESDLTTGKPKRRALVQGLACAQARNKVDLLDQKTAAFLQALVAGGIITAQRKTEILSP